MYAAENKTILLAIVSYKWTQRIRQIMPLLLLFRKPPAVREPHGGEHFAAVDKMMTKTKTNKWARTLNQGRNEAVFSTFTSVDFVTESFYASKGKTDVCAGST